MSLPTGFERRSDAGPPFGLAFIGLATAVGLLALVALAEIRQPGTIDGAASRKLGAMAATMFGVATVLSAHRGLTGNDRTPWALTAVLLVPGVGWSMAAFSGSAGAMETAWSPQVLAVVAAGNGVLAAVLLWRGVDSGRWSEVYGGLGSLTLALVTAAGLLAPAPVPSAALAVLSALAAMICLYGLLVEIEIGEPRASGKVDLAHWRRRLAVEIDQAEQHLRHLRSTLEATGPTGGPDVDEPERTRSPVNRSRSVTARATGERV
ncbi:MAG: hypothetical protein ACFCVK_08245 [Acidimicrobiales bacterium]